jgi:hypothetical protein
VGEGEEEDVTSDLWTHPLTIALVAVGSSLLTIVLTPLLQNHFWRYQRRDELRLTAVAEYNRLTTEFISNVLWVSPAYTPPPEWFAAVNVVSGNIRALFSDRAYDAAKAIDPFIKVGPLGGTTAQRIKNAHDFADTRDAALRVLYDEVLRSRWKRWLSW